MTVDPQEQRYQAAIAVHGDAISRLARAVEADPQRQRELVQDMHLRLWQSFAAFDGRCSERTWVFRVAHNAAASHVDRERRQVRTTPAEVDTADLGSLHDQVERKNALEVVRHLVRALPVRDRQVTLLYLEGLDATEISEVIGGTPNAVAVRLTRARALLAERFHGGST